MNSFPFSDPVCDGVFLRHKSDDQQLQSLEVYRLSQCFPRGSVFDYVLRLLPQYIPQKQSYSKTERARRSQQSCR